jgi:hypothetical protein
LKSSVHLNETPQTCCQNERELKNMEKKPTSGANPEKWTSQGLEMERESD